MQQKEIKNIAQKIDEAHGSQIQYTYKAHKPSFLKRILIFLVVLLLVTGVPYFGYKGTLYILQNITGEQTVESESSGYDSGEEDNRDYGDEDMNETDIKDTEETPEEAPVGLSVSGAIDASDTAEIVLSDSSFKVYQKPIEGSLDAYNLTLDIQKTPPVSPLAINKIFGSRDGALGAVYSSMGFSEIDKELLNTEGGASAIELGTNLGQPIPEPRTLEAKTQLLQRMNNVLALDPYAVVATGYNRQETYTKYVRELTNLESIASKTFEDVQLEIDQLEGDIRDLNNEQKQLSSNLSKSTESLSTQGLEEQLNLVNEVSSKLLAAQNRKQQLDSLEALYKAATSSLQLRIEAVQKNSDAIIQGVKVTPVEGSGVELTQ